MLSISYDLHLLRTKYFVCVAFAIFKDYYYYYCFLPSVESVFVSHYKTKFVSRELSRQLRAVTLKKTCHAGHWSERLVSFVCVMQNVEYRE
jgi:hypothetical protein